MQRRLERLRQTLLDVGPDAQAVDDGLDGVLLVLVEVGGMVEVGYDAVDSCPDEAVGREFREDMLMLPLAVPDHRRQHHDP